MSEPWVRAPTRSRAAQQNRSSKPWRITCRSGQQEEEERPEEEHDDEEHAMLAEPEVLRCH